MKHALSAASIGLALLMTPTVRAADLKVFVTTAARGPYEVLAPQFQMATGHRLITEYDLPLALARKAAADEPFDVIILSLDVEGLIREGKVTSQSRTVLGLVGVGVAIKQGTPKPEFSTVDAFKNALLKAKSIGTSGEGSSGRYVSSLIERLGLTSEVAPKIRSGGAGYSAQLLSRGDVDFVVSGLPPLLGTPNIEWLGYLPNELQSWLIFSGGISTRAREPEAASAFLHFLTTPEARKVFKANGLEEP